MKRQPPMRVGAILSATSNEIRFLGYGTYVGDKIPPEETAGFNLGRPNPKIELDNGDVVWGCQCWWDAEEKMKTHLEKRPKTQALVEVRMADELKK